MAEQKDALTGPRPETWWTGPKPQLGHNVRSLPQVRLDRMTREEALNYFDNSWLLTEVLFSALQGEKAFHQPPPHGLRHPLIFYYGHPAVLYVNKLRVAGLLTGPVNPAFEHLFEVGVDEMSWDDMSKNEMRWPSVAEVGDYRREVYRLVRKMIETHPALDDSQKPFLQTSPVWALAMSFEHERIHLETSSVLMRELPVQFLRTPEHWPKHKAAPSHVSAPNEFRAVSGGEVRLGKPADFPTFGWDNEYGLRTDIVPEFRASRFLISNQECQLFVAAGGYREAKYWTAEGWKWRQFRNAKWPAFWTPDGPSGLNKFKLRNLFEIGDFEPSLPAVVNFHEAKAYAAWKTEADASPFPYRLISESEHHRLRSLAGDGKWNYGLSEGGETAVDAHVSNGWGDVFGNLWQWCEDDLNPLPGFKPHPYYDDFSTPCFDGKHQMILGGSFVSSGDEASAWARFHFRPHFFQHAGFRLVQPLGHPSPAVKLDANTNASIGYEATSVLHQYLLLHYGNEAEVAPKMKVPADTIGFPSRVAQIVSAQARKLNLPLKRALDIGCAVGASSFELARTFENVTGVDISASFIDAAKHLKTDGSHPYLRSDEADLQTSLVAKIPDDVKRERVVFRQADACSLPADFVDYDAVLMANLLCRLPSPRACLSRMAGPRGVVRPGGLLVLVSPYSWMRDYTAPESWLGGFMSPSGPVSSNETLKTILSPNFELLEEGDVPLVIREHSRKFQYIVSNLMVWRRKVEA